MRRLCKQRRNFQRQKLRADWHLRRMQSETEETAHLVRMDTATVDGNRVLIESDAAAEGLSCLDLRREQYRCISLLQCVPSRSKLFLHEQPQPERVAKAH